MTHLLDLSSVPCPCANHGLDALHKAIATDASEGLLWRPHENPWLTDTVEAWTAARNAELLALQAALFGALGLAPPVALLRKAMSETERQALKARLNKPMAQYAPADWVAFVDLLFHTHLAPDVQAQAVDDLAMKTALAGTLQAIGEGRVGSAARRPGPGVLRRIVRGVANLPPVRALNDGARNALDWAKARIGLNLRGVTDAGRDRISRSILNHVEAHGLAAPGKLEQTLLDDFGTLNRDWRRVAVTEAGETANAAFLMQFEEGARIQRLEAYEGACPFCAKINGQVFTWTKDPRPDEGWTYVWPGKTNVGRSASPRKQTPLGLVAREPEELWWPAAGVMHPSCRGFWRVLPSTTPPPGVRKEFVDWLEREFPF